MRTVDLFCGCGGLSLGFLNEGFKVVAGFESSHTAVDCYGINLSRCVFPIDLSNTHRAVKLIRKATAPDIIIGGPPCQDFSQAGKRIEADRADLTESFAKIICRVKPAYFVMENVTGAPKSQAYMNAREMFKKAGYGLTEVKLDASRCGVPQKRIRFFCIGAIGEEDDFMLEDLLSGLSEEQMTLRDYFGDTLDFEFYYRHPRNYGRRGIFSIDEPSPTIRGVNRPVPPGYHGHPGDACPLDGNIRALTYLERAQIQTFPADYHWVGTKTEIEQMIGNAVPVKLAEYVAEKLADFIRRKDCSGETAAEDASCLQIPARLGIRAVVRIIQDFFVKK